MIVKKPSPKAPDFIIANLSFKVEEVVAFLQEHSKNGWVNVQIKESRGGKFYGQLDTWEKGKKDEPEESPDGSGSEEIGADDIPY